ncbi:16594_t:CDS:2 [Funneliformis caledonium]|uniref:16594_t:CDS:1 n=1 Tax=Funneliformis caledonium TaxID=1117310 RepID=A0A9N9HMR9_9GLOM|nr:16594_t:CDS:2 [Funneliformis caledonium]
MFFERKKILFLAIVFMIFCILAATSELITESSPFEEDKTETKKYIITFYSGVSEETINNVKEQVVNSGGIIYQEFFIIKGFAAKMKVPLVHTLTKDFSNILSMEEDSVG